jgi:hypothetical protein
VNNSSDSVTEMRASTLISKGKSSAFYSLVGLKQNVIGTFYWPTNWLICIWVSSPKIENSSEKFGSEYILMFKIAIEGMHSFYSVSINIGTIS